MLSQRQSVRLLAAAFTAGPFDDWESLKSRVSPLVGDLRKARWLTSLSKQLADEFRGAPRPNSHLVCASIRANDAFTNAWRRGKVQINNVASVLEMAPASGAPTAWKIPPITSISGLASTLKLHPDDLGWLTAFGQAEHYLHQWREKRKSGHWRLLEVPKPLLKQAQRQILRQILDEIPPHESATGFRRGSSIRDYVSPHTNQQLLVRMDLEDFFPSIGAARIMRLFMTAGYPETIASLLTRLTTHAAPIDVIASKPLTFAQRNRLCSPHLPQGASTSPALANLSAFRLDCRLAGLAKAAGASYTRYADDLLFSGKADFAQRARRFVDNVGGIVIDEGFQLNHRKTRLQNRGSRQAAAGIVINDAPNIARPEFDRLKAILTNCIRHGPATQNRDHHPDFRAFLGGKVGWVEFINPAKGQQLQKLFSDICWGD